jgi:anti-sigma factor RsiW
VNCAELVELVTHYLEGELPADDTRRFEEHIESCMWCKRYLEQMKTTITVVGRLDAESISPEARDTLLRTFRDWTAGERPLP